MGRSENGPVAPMNPVEPLLDQLVEPLPQSLTWSATLDPHDETREIEITEEMVCLAIAEIECEQVYPFGGDTARVARPVTRAEVIPFPASRRRVEG